MRTLTRTLGVLVVMMLVVAPGATQAAPASPGWHAVSGLPSTPPAPTPKGYTRIRHYTNKAGFDRIVRDRVIRARDRGRVFGQNARDRVLSPRDAEKRFGLGKGRGNHYVETDYGATG